MHNLSKSSRTVPWCPYLRSLPHACWSQVARVRVSAIQEVRRERHNIPSQPTPLTHVCHNALSILNDMLRVCPSVIHVHKPFTNSRSLLPREATVTPAVAWPTCRRASYKILPGAAAKFLSKGVQELPANPPPLRETTNLEHVRVHAAHTWTARNNQPRGNAGARRASQQFIAATRTILYDVRRLVNRQRFVLLPPGQLAPTAGRALLFELPLQFPPRIPRQTRRHLHLPTACFITTRTTSTRFRFTLHPRCTPHRAAAMSGRASTAVAMFLSV